MLLPWSKKSTLSITSQGVAFRDSNGKIQLLTEPNYQWTNETQFAELLKANQAILKHQNIWVLLSNTLVRYLVLPPQNKIFSRKDLLAIAQHEFRKQYGSVADAWIVSVSLSNYGQAVIAAAMDESLYSQLEASAKTLNFTIVSVQPFLMTILNLTPHQHSSWILVAEPQRIVLCRSRKKEWQKIVIDSPPAGFEYQHAEQLINLNLLNSAANEQPENIASYVSPVLQKMWGNSQNTRQKLILKLSAVEAHAAWMARFITYARAKKVNLDFTDKSHINRNVWDLCLLTFAVLAFGFVYTQYQKTSEKLNQAEHKAQLTERSKPNLIASPELEDKVKLAQQAQQQLNLPWMHMLAALESVKKDSPNIAILGINPNKNRSEIKLTGQTEQFSDITQFLDTLRSNPNFTDAVLVSQHLGDEQAKLFYVFEINVGWRI